MLQDDQRQSLLIVFEKSHQTIKALDGLMRDKPSPWDMVLCAGAGKLLGDLYMSIERIMRLFVEDVYGERIAKDEAWHQRLIESGAARGLLPEGIDSPIREMRRFRHRLMHGYGVEMDEDKLRECIPDAIAAYEKVETHIREKYPELHGATTVATGDTTNRVDYEGEDCHTLRGG